MSAGAGPIRGAEFPGLLLLAPLDGLDWLQEPLEHVQWSIERVLATLAWNVDRQLLIGAVLIHSLRKWITGQGGILDLAMVQLLVSPESSVIKDLVAGAVVLALLVAAIMFALRGVLGRSFAPVDLRKIALWFAVAAYLFAAGPALVRELEDFRADLSSAAYGAAAGVNAAVAGGSGQGYNNTGGEVPTAATGYLSPTQQIFVTTTHVYHDPHEITGVDVAAAYLFATQEDINGTNPQALPGGAAAHYFQDGQGYSPWAPNADEPARQQALDRALDGIVRMLTGVVPSLFAVLQAVIFLALALAAAIILLSLPLTLVFAFFNATEVITLAVLRSYVGLLIKTFVISMILAIEMGFLVYWANQANWLAFLGMSLVILFFTWQFVSLAIQTVTGSLNVITQAVGAATGTRLAALDPPGLAASAVQGLGGLTQTGIQAAGILLAPETGGLSLAVAGLGAGLVGAGAAALAHAVPGQTAPAGAQAGAELEAGVREGLWGFNRWAAFTARRAAAREDAPGAAATAPLDPAEPTATMNAYLAGQGIPPVRSTPRGWPAPPPETPAAATGTLAGMPAAEAAPGAADLGTALAAYVAAPPATPLPPALQALPGATQTALAGMAGRYRPEDAGRVVAATQQVAAGFAGPGALAAAFLDAGGQLARESAGVQAVLAAAGPAGAAFADAPAGPRDLLQLVGAGLGLQRTFGAAEIAGAIGQAVEAGGGAGAAAAALGVAPGAWGSRYSAVQGVIAGSAAAGLTRAGDVARVIGLVQRSDPATLLAGDAPALPAADRALVQQVAGAMAGRPAAAGATEAAAAPTWRNYVQDIRALPPTVTALVVPVPAADAAAGAPGEAAAPGETPG